MQTMNGGGFQSRGGTRSFGEVKFCKLELSKSRFHRLKHNFFTLFFSDSGRKKFDLFFKRSEVLNLQDLRISQDKALITQ